jgi:hypothetical protein
MMNKLENKAHKQGTQVNEALTKPYNPIFEIIIKKPVEQQPLHV